MDERRAHDTTDVVVSAGAEILGQKIRGDVGGDGVAPALEQRLLAALLWVATVGTKQRMNGPAKRGGIELRGGEPVEGVDVSRNGSAATIVATFRDVAATRVANFPAGAAIFRLSAANLAANSSFRAATIWQHGSIT